MTLLAACDPGPTPRLRPEIGLLDPIGKRTSHTGEEGSMGNPPDRVNLRYAVRGQSTEPTQITLTGRFP